MNTNYVGKNSITRFLEKLYETFSKKGHAHSKADILDFPSFEGLATETYVDTKVSAKLDKSELNSSINTALTQAKDSGEFDGADGISATHSWSGTTLTITSASGTSSVNLKGDKGDSIKGDKGDPGINGTTPVRGTDYWTASDIAEIKSYVDDAILGGAW